MIEFMEKVVIQLILWSSLEEHYLLPVACKNVIGIRCASWRIVSSIEYREEGCVNMDCATLIEDYHNKIEVELNKICVGILKLFASHLPPSLIVPKSKVFYLKMKGDYYRILLWRSWPPYPIRLWLMLNLSTLLILLVVSPNRQSQRMKGTHSQQQPKS